METIFALTEYWNQPLFQVGVISLLLFSIYRVLIKSRLIAPIPKSESWKILGTLLNHGFVIALLVTLLGFGLEFFKIYYSSVSGPPSEPSQEKSLIENNAYYTSVPLSYWTANKPEYKFPVKILYNIKHNGSFVGKCEFSALPYGVDLLMLMLKNFVGLGFDVDHKRVTYVFYDNISFYDGFLQKKKPDQDEYDTIYEIKLTQQNLDGVEKQFFKFRDYGETGYGGNQIKQSELLPEIKQTEILPDYRVADLLSLFLIVSKKVSNETYMKQETFNLLLHDKIKLVNMVFGGNEKIVYENQERLTDILIVNYSDLEFIRFNIYRDIDNDFCFPVQVLIQDEQGNKIELATDKIAYSNFPVFLNHSGR